MAEDAVKEALDGVVKAIGFGIVSDFRELYDAMRNISADISEGNTILAQVNENAKDMNKALDDFNKASFNRRFTLGARKAEESLEGRARLNAQRSEDSLNRILKAIEELNRSVKLGAATAEDGSVVDDVAGGLLGGMMSGRGGSFLRGAASIAKKTAIGAGLIGAVVAVGAAGSYLMGGGDSGESSGGSLGPASTPAGSASVPTTGSDLAKMGGVNASVGSIAGAAALVSRSTMSAKQKALAKVGPKVPSYIAKFGGRISDIIGVRSIPIFGALIGGYFSFSKFMSGDSWQAIGAEYVAGVTPDTQSVGGTEGYLAGVASTLAIQTYLICRDIYQEENALDIKNNVVPNFDDLEASEKVQVLNSVKGYVEAHVNSLISRASTADSTTGIAPTSMSGTGMGAPPPTLGGTGAAMGAAAAAAGGTGAAMGGAVATGGDTGGAPTAPVTPPAATPPAAAPANTAAQGQMMQNLYSSPQTTGGAAASPYVRTDTGAAGSQPIGASPSDNMATFNTSSDQTSMYTGQDIPVSEIVQTGSGYNVVRLADGSVVKRTGARNWRNNNPGNIEYGEFAKNRGAIGSDGRFAIFPDMTTGRAAKEALLFEGKNYRDKTIAQAINRYAPPSENNTASYIANVSQAAGVNPNTPLAALDPNQRAAMMNEMAKVEGLRPGKVEVIQAAQRMAEGGKIIPLSADQPKAGKDLSIGLQPPKQSDSMRDEDETTMSQQSIDARKKQATTGGSPQEKTKNMISSYTPYMSFLFGTMTSELNSNVNGEVTSDEAFENAMNPLS